MLHGAERNQPSLCGERPAGSPGLTPEVSDEPAATTAHTASPLRQEPQEGLRAQWGHVGATPLPGAQGSSGGGRGGGMQIDPLYMERVEYENSYRQEIDCSLYSAGIRGGDGEAWAVATRFPYG